MIGFRLRSRTLLVVIFNICVYTLLTIEEERILTYWKQTAETYHHTTRVLRVPVPVVANERSHADTIVLPATEAGGDRGIGVGTYGTLHSGQESSADPYKPKTTETSAIATDALRPRHPPEHIGAARSPSSGPENAEPYRSVAKTEDGTKMRRPEEKTNLRRESRPAVSQSEDESESESESVDETVDQRKRLFKKSKRNHSSAKQQSPPKIAIYMTTSMSFVHRFFLQKCWPTSMERLELVQKADLIVYTSDLSGEFDKDITSLGFKNVVFHRFEETPFADMTRSQVRQKQEGAVRAMLDPFQDKNHQWFEGYDWIIRLNPDVLIRNDTWMLQQMMKQTEDNEPAVDAIFGAWSEHPNALLTDFHAFRPHAVNVTALFQKYERFRPGESHAESHIYPGFAHLIQSGRVAWIPNIEFPGLAARIGGAKCDIVHDHKFINFCKKNRDPGYMDYNVSYNKDKHLELVE
ncbi:expressed unknown protein [Seminavis robusta]|uniref:Uncharacterized protein n=1 Tax=Seminavis robusta TaxID=568900 RepID=A0A9N8EPQ9_9STRA|nr:expressed unknown protein [Seminavis robusta]|eukprot:Sro1547_g281510.1 n/a (465) ;mRNA; r:19959-21353